VFAAVFAAVPSPVPFEYLDVVNVAAWVSEVQLVSKHLDTRGLVAVA